MAKQNDYSLYALSYTGEVIDNAIKNVNDNKDNWSDKYTKQQTDAKLSSKAEVNGSADKNFNANILEASQVNVGDMMIANNGITTAYGLEISEEGFSYGSVTIDDGAVSIGNHSLSQKADLVNYEQDFVAKSVDTVDVTALTVTASTLKLGETSLTENQLKALLALIS